MKALLFFKNRQLHIIEQAISNPNSYSLRERRHFPDMRDKVLRDKAFIEEKMGESFYEDTGVYSRNKLEILNHIKRDAKTMHNNGMNHDEIVQDPNTITWLNLMRETRTFEFRNYDVRSEMRSYHELMYIPPYGPPRDVEMVHDYLINFMTDGDSGYLCITMALHIIANINI